MPLPTDHFARLFDYEFRCTGIVVQSLHQAQRTVEQLSLASLAAPLERAIAIFCHVQAARRLWLHRIRPDLTPFPPDGVFPIWRLIKAEQEARDLDGLWKACIDDLPSRDLTALIPYTSTEDVAYQSTLADILTHVVNHSTYHRGQIANLVAATGTKPAVTDYIALTRKPLG